MNTQKKQTKSQEKFKKQKKKKQKKYCLVKINVAEKNN